MLKKMVAMAISGFAVVVMAGCGGTDLSGKYVSVPTSENDTVSYILDVKKGDKDKYNMNVYRAKYYVSAHYGEGSVYHMVHAWPEPNAPKEKNIYKYDVKATFDYDNWNQIVASAPDKSNTMTYKTSRTMGLMAGNLEVDKEGNLVDMSGGLADGEKGLKFKKVKEVNMDEIKKKLQEAVTNNAHKVYDYERGDTVSSVNNIEFKDKNSK